MDPACHLLVVHIEASYCPCIFEAKASQIGSCLHPLKWMCTFMILLLLLSLISLRAHAHKKKALRKSTSVFLFNASILQSFKVPCNVNGEDQHIRRKHRDSFVCVKWLSFSLPFIVTHFTHVWGMLKLWIGYLSLWSLCSWLILFFVRLFASILMAMWLCL